MIIRKLSDKKPNILIFQGSPRKENSCANQDPKTKKLVDFIYNEWAPFANIDVIDLSIGDVTIQPCKGCVSTSNGFHCHWKCVAEDQRVHTKDGFKKIKDLKIGEILQDGNRVINHVKTSDSEEIFEVKLKDGRKIELTKDHKVKVLIEGKESWVEVEKLKSDYLIPAIYTDRLFNYTGVLNLDGKSAEYDSLREDQMFLSRSGICSIITEKDGKFTLEYIHEKSTTTTIKSIKSVGFKPVYDIEVENSHEFNCEGINIHNCSCYGPNSKKKPDLMYDAMIYDKLEMCDAFLVVSPIHWYSVSTQVKAMFDRLVCANQTITKEEAIEIMGEGNIKNSKITGKTELSGKYKSMLKNHLKGKTAAFFVHGDNGANDYDGNQPNTGDNMWDVKNSVMPLVYQCRYSEINCPDELVEAVYVNEGVPYYKANILNNDILIQKINDLFERLLINLNQL
jgi:multimeric flavodoxin WrbA